MRKSIILGIFLLLISITPNSYASVKTCTSTQLKKINQTAIDYNNNRSYFLKFIVSINRAIDGINKSRMDKDASGEKAWRDNYVIATSEAKKDRLKGLALEKNLRALLINCKSGYGVKFSPDYGFLTMNKNVKGISFPEFIIPFLDEENESSPNTSPQSSTLPGSVVALDKYFNRLAVGWKNSTARSLSIGCINDAPRLNVVKGLRVLLALSSYGSSLAAGTQWFPKSFTSSYASRIKTWDSSSAPFLYVELELSSTDGNPCDAVVKYLPVIGDIGLDVNYAGILLVDSSNAIAVINGYSRNDGFWNSP